uniref:Coiled-coil domain containing 177 n=1 Tax=Neogobius melanostomus TaxID=47308 RepID=A0A8C6WE72_9GOBI
AREITMGEIKSTTSPLLHLDLNNFESAEAQRSRYVLTSPRSLESCERLGVKPVELLIKSLNQMRRERRDVPFEVVKVMHEMYEKERMRLLHMCRAEREKLIQGCGGRSRWSGGQKTPEVGSKISRPQKASNDKSYEPPVAYADLCSRQKSGITNKERDRSTLSSISLGDLRQSPAMERKLEKITMDINKEMHVTVSDVDRKIAALMLVRHDKEQSRLEQSYKEDQDREEARKKMEIERMEVERKKLRKLKKSMERWHEELEVRKRFRNKLEKQKLAQLQQEALLHEDKWNRLKWEVEEQRKEKLRAAVKEAEERKRNQERLLRGKEEEDKKVLEQERLLSVEREQRAKMNKALQELKERRRYVLTKQRIEQQEEEEEVLKRQEIERKMEKCSKKYADVLEARLRELKQRVAQEEEQIHRAKLRAKLQSTELLMHKRVLHDLSQCRMEKAAQHASHLNKSKAMEVKQRNSQREKCHQQLRERREAQEAAIRKMRENCVLMKEQRRERLQRQREQIQEEANRLARASFHLRDRVRQHTSSNTFDQMVKEAQLYAAMTHMKLQH